MPILVSLTYRLSVAVLANPCSSPSEATKTTGWTCERRTTARLLEGHWWVPESPVVELGIELGMELGMLLADAEAGGVTQETDELVLVGVGLGAMEAELGVASMPSVLPAESV
jgi:hypothetical protein